MALQQTSLEAYREVRATLGRRQTDVLNVFQKEGLTNMEIAEILGWSINRVTPRVYELRAIGLLKEEYKRLCSITHRRAIAWKKTFRRFGEQYD